MVDKVNFELVSPERLMAADMVEMVVVPGGEGDFGVLPGHTPMISTVRPGTISVYENDKIKSRIFVAGGFAEVTPSRCTVLAEQAQPVAEIDRAAVEQQLKDARENLADAKDDGARATAARQIAVGEAMLAAESA